MALGPSLPPQQLTRVLAVVSLFVPRLHVYEYFACVYSCVPSACLVSPESEGGVRAPGTGVIDSWEPPCGFWELNPGPLQEQRVLLLATEPVLQPLGVLFNHGFIYHCVPARHPSLVLIHDVHSKLSVWGIEPKSIILL